VSGLCAIVRFDGAPIDPGALPRMAAATPRRGALQVATSPVAHLGGQGRDGAGPATRGATTVVASARLDNRDELLPLLRAHLDDDHPSDARLILAAHEAWGPDAAGRLVGDYAYLLVDHERRTLLAVRDPMGMRPLYLHATPERVLAASEIRQLLASGEVAAEVHEPAVARYLIGEFGVQDETFYGGVEALPAGHLLEIDAGGRRRRRYWDVDPGRRERFDRAEAIAERFRELFLRAVEDRLRDGEPAGLFLSGGVDSGSIASSVGWLREQGRVRAPLHTYSWAFDSLPECDERHLSRHVVERYAFPAHDLSVDASAPLSAYPKHGPHPDEPYCGVYQGLLEAGLAAASDAGLRSMWSGDRGDLVSGAWSADYLALLRGGQWRDLAYELRDHATLPGRSWPGVVADHVVGPALRRTAQKVRRTLAGPGPRVGGPPLARGPRHDPRRPPWLRTEFLQRTGVDPAEVHDAVAPAGLEGVARRMRYDLVFVPMHMRGMVWSERTNAAFGLGFVDPWSDRRLAEFVVALPQAALDHPGELRKRLVREAMRGVMPEALRQGAAKIVPSPLFQRTLRETGVGVVRDLLTDMEAERRGYLDGGALRAHYEGVVAGGRDHPTLWWALTLEMWLRRYWRR